MKRRVDDERIFRPQPSGDTGEFFGQNVGSSAQVPTIRVDLGRLPAGSQPVETSEEAKERLTPERLAKRRLDVLRWFVARGEHGGTADELAEAFNLVHNAVAPRVTELVAMLLVEKTATKRKTRQGSPAFVHVATAAGRAKLTRAA